MQQIEPSLTQQDIICVETPGQSCALVVFGASGDLVRRKLLVGLFNLFTRGLLSDNFYLLGCGRKQLSDDEFRQTAIEAIREVAPKSSKQEVESFAGRLYYTAGSYDQTQIYERMKTRLSELDEAHKTGGRHIFYLAVPPFLYETIAAHLGRAQLHHCGKTDCREHVRIVVEKPIGKDLKSSEELNSVIGRYFDESQIYRIDHYLGKETVQNILIFRFANTIFEPVWNRDYIDHVQISIAETLGVEHRGGYYDKSGALRDMFQNHMLQMLALVAMEPPTSFEADRIRDEKVKLLRAIRPLTFEPWSNSIVTGQYGPGIIDGAEVIGYREEPDVDSQSSTETYVAAKVFIDNWRWKGVPFYLRTGKRLAAKLTEIAITFREIPHSMFISVGLEEMAANVLVLRIQPAEGISLSFQAKRPGSKICMSPLQMSFDYQNIFGVSMPQAYERLLLDCMVGDQTLFTRQDSVRVAWQLLMPVLEAWQQEKQEPHLYSAGSESFAEVDNLIESDGRKWRRLT
jgi:glucose-6-phosphate 1-dehydrogenase